MQTFIFSRGVYYWLVGLEGVRNKLPGASVLQSGERARTDPTPRQRLIDYTIMNSFTNHPQRVTEIADWIMFDKYTVHQDDRNDIGENDMKKRRNELNFLAPGFVDFTVRFLFLNRNRLKYNRRRCRNAPSNLPSPSILNNSQRNWWGRNSLLPCHHEPEPYHHSHPLIQNHVLSKLSRLIPPRKVTAFRHKHHPTTLTKYHQPQPVLHHLPPKWTTNRQARLTNLQQSSSTTWTKFRLDRILAYQAIASARHPRRATRLRRWKHPCCRRERHSNRMEC